MKRFALVTFIILLFAIPSMAAVNAAQNTKTIDPCSVATVAQLGPIMNTVVAAAFPIPWSKPGKRATISDPEVLNTTCAPLRVEVRAKIHYRDTRGFDQGSASGQVRFAGSVLAKIKYTGAAPITSSNFVSAQACIGDINVLALNINNVPNWLDNTWVRGILQERLGGMQRCKDFSPYVAAYLASGKTIP